MPTPAATRAPLRIDGATLRLVRLPLVTPFTIATGTLTEKVFPLLTLRADGLEGHAEGVMDPLPDYLEETVAGAMDLLATALIPQVLGQRFAHPESLARRFAPWRANFMARATVEMAFWDLWAKSLDLPLQAVLTVCLVAMLTVMVGRHESPPPAVAPLALNQVAPATESRLPAAPPEAVRKRPRCC